LSTTEKGRKGNKVFYQFKAKHSTLEQAKGYINIGGAKDPKEYKGAAYDNGSKPETVFAE
jgi:hypothetical protein